MIAHRPIARMDENPYKAPREPDLEKRPMATHTSDILVWLAVIAILLAVIALSVPAQMN